jgi:hypothetical protein
LRILTQRKTNPKIGKSTYEILVDNCLDTVIDVKDAAIKYLEEFHRLKNSVYIPNYNKQIDFILKSIKQEPETDPNTILLSKRVSFEGDDSLSILVGLNAYDVISNIQQLETTTVEIMLYAEIEQEQENGSKNSEILTRICKYRKI